MGWDSEAIFTYRSSQQWLSGKHSRPYSGKSQVRILPAALFMIHQHALARIFRRILRLNLGFFVLVS